MEKQNFRAKWGIGCVLGFVFYFTLFCLVNHAYADISDQEFSHIKTVLNIPNISDTSLIA
jgi:hypothetical protein